MGSAVGLARTEGGDSEIGSIEGTGSSVGDGFGSNDGVSVEVELKDTGKDVEGVESSVEMGEG